MSAAIVKTSSMPGMPVMSGTEGALTAVIRYIAPIYGWDIMYDSGLVIVIKPQSYKGGQALLYRFDDRAARGGGASRIAEVKAYESMSTIDTGAGLVGPVYVHKSYTSDSTVRRYYIIGDQYGMILASSHVFDHTDVYGYAEGFQYIGFLNSFGNETPVCSLFGNGDAEGSFGYIAYQPDSITSTSGQYCFIHKNRAGSVNIPTAVFCPGFQQSNYAFGNSNNTTAYPAYQTGAAYTIARPFVNDGSIYTCRGQIPGMVVLFCTDASVDSSFQRMSSSPSSIVPTELSEGSFVRTFIRCRGVGIDCDAQGLLCDIGVGFRV